MEGAFSKVEEMSFSQLMISPGMDIPYKENEFLKLDSALS